MASERETQQGRDGRVHLLLVLCECAEGAVGSSSACHVGEGNYTVAPVKCIYSTEAFFLCCKIETLSVRQMLYSGA